jgi:acyl carrier protein
METSDTLFQLCAKVFDVAPESISDATSPRNMAKWDSLASLALAMTVEEVYAIKLDTTDMMRIRSVGQLRAVLRQKGVLDVIGKRSDESGTIEQVG